MKSNVKKRESPDVVIVVLDCVGAPYLSRDSLTDPISRELASKLDDAVWFDHAVSTSSWTVPAHASILTGLYPWNSACFGRSGNLWPILDPKIPRLQDMLRPRGYATACLSGNPLLGPSSHCGLDSRFDQVHVSEPWEVLLRVPPKLSGIARKVYQNTSKEQVELKRESGALGIASYSLGMAIRGIGLRLPATLYFGSRVARIGLGNGRGLASEASPWIEGRLREFIQHSDPARPFFTLLNLVDAHEPFFPSRWRPNGRSTSELLRVRQDFSSIVDGKWIPTEDDYSILRELYRGAVNAAISRVVGIIAILREQRRWDETVFVLTADHGQALGQEGVPLHGGPPIDALVRIPLIVRLPGAVARSPPTCTEWASLADVVPTVLKAVGIQSPNGLDGEPLQTVASTGPTPRKVFSYGEGMFGWKPDLSYLLRFVRGWISRPSQCTQGVVR